MGGWVGGCVGGCACAVRVGGGGCERGCCREKLPGPTRVRLSVRACARLRARVCTRFDPWCWWRHRHGDGHVMIMRWSCRCVHFAAIMFTATAMPHSRRLCAAAGPAHSRVVHSVSGTKHRTDVSRNRWSNIAHTCPHLVPSAVAFFGMVRGLFLAMQLRKVSGERDTVPERIPRSVSVSRST